MIAKQAWKNIPWHIEVEVTKTIIKLRLSREEEDTTVTQDLAFIEKAPNSLIKQEKKKILKTGNWLTLNLSELKNEPSFKDGAVYVVSSDEGTLNLREPFSYSSDSFASKQTFSNWLKQNRISTALTLVFPSTECDFLNCGLKINYNEILGMKCNLKVPEMTQEEFVKRIRPQLVLEGPKKIKPDQTVEYKIKVNGFDGKVFRYPLNIHLLATGGYLPHNRIVIKNGEGSFRFMSTGLLTNELVKVKLGYAFYQSLVEQEIEIA